MDKSKKMEAVLNWISTGAFSSSLAFVTLIPTFSEINNFYKQFSLLLFVLSIPVLSTALVKFKLRQINEAYISEGAKTYEILSIGGSILVVVAFTIFIVGLGLQYAIALFASLFLVVVGLKLASKSK